MGATLFTKSVHFQLDWCCHPTMPDTKLISFPSFTLSVCVFSLWSKRSDLIRKRSDCSNAPRNPQVDLCVFASFSCRVYAETQGRDVRPVAGLTHSIGVFFVFPFLDDNKLRRRVHTMPEVPYTNVWCSGKTMHIAKIIQ